MATIYRTTASCGIQGKPMPSAAKAIRSAEIKAGRCFILGRSIATHENFGPDKTAFMEEAARYAISAMRKRKVKVQRYSVNDSSKDCTLEIERVES